jgi:regulatory protein
VADSNPKKRRVPRKATAKSLNNGALYYLQRYSSSAENLRRVLMRRVDRSARHHDIDRGQAAAAVEDIIQRFVCAGLLDDAQFARARAATLHRRGLSARAVRAKLMEKGVAAKFINAAIDGLGDTDLDPELTAAAGLARRRRLGPYRTSGRTSGRTGGNRAETRDKDLAALARNGFGYAVAQIVIDADTVESLEARIAENWLN